MGWSWWRFLWGAVGACAPEAFRIHRIATGKTKERVTRSIPVYIVATIIWAGVGGVFAVAWGDNHPLKCLWVGVSLPAIISGLATQFPKTPL